MNEAASQIMAEFVGARPATADETSARSAAATLLGSLGGKGRGPTRAAKPDAGAKAKRATPGRQRAGR